MHGQVSPREQIALVYVIGDTTDGNTYYPQVVMRDAATGIVLGTANLAQDASISRRYYGTIQAPQDNTGRGRFIDLTYTVYSDSDHTTVVDTLPEQNTVYIVQERISAALLASGGKGEASSVGPDIDYKRIGKMLTDLGKTLSAEIQAAKTEVPEQKELDQEALITSLLLAIASYMEPHNAHVRDNLATIHDRAKAIEDGLPALIAKMPDFEPVFQRFEKLGLSHQAVMEALGPAIVDVVEAILRREFASFTQSAHLFMRDTASETRAMNGPSDTGEPSARPTARKGVRDYHSEARALLRLKP